MILGSQDLYCDFWDLRISIGFLGSQDLYRDFWDLRICIVILGYQDLYYDFWDPQLFICNQLVRCVFFKSTLITIYSTKHSVAIFHGYF